MFRFDFALGDDANDDNDNLLRIVPPALPGNPPLNSSSEPFRQLSLSHLLDTLPPLISSSPLVVPISSKNAPLILPRRDLFDARFQLISESNLDDTLLKFLDSPSDLVPGQYEGGFKTWECSLDVVDYLENSNVIPSPVGKQVLEVRNSFITCSVGCGTAVPSMYLLQRLFSSAVDTDKLPRTLFHLQDYNASVLEYVTLPNLFLVWYMSPAGRRFHESLHQDVSLGGSNTLGPSIPCEVNITPELKQAFLSALQERNISLCFFSGSWNQFNLEHVLDNAEKRTYDVVITSETIYRTESLPSLINLLKLSCIGSNLTQTPYVCLVAAKVLYFGVGGGVNDFIQASKEQIGTSVETVWEHKEGIARKVLRIIWS
ncbi:hypothetical protein AMATHDRAFT_49792 [Amanita thiersii Skay4041]|uniref:protein-histidine N-methyltransferase n=1 Tax=Amanita thiersii Skay4041 TaxID=703135 RepID=A0A2A9NBS5_9AGAR|nr:hypothetical protein AMATHDRAFT_49792 [Amanita thiersii Skay4041]